MILPVESLEDGSLVHAAFRAEQPNIGALMIRIGLWGPLYCNYNAEPPKIVLVIT